MDTSKLSRKELKGLRDRDNIKFIAISKNILNKAQNQQVLTEVEKDHLCGLIDPNGVIEPLVASIRQNFDFRVCYLTYNDDLTGGSVYKNYKDETISIPEAQLNLKNLMDEAEAWKLEIKAASADLLMKACLKETDLHILNFEKKEFSQGIALGGRRRYEHGISKIYLFSKYIYLLSKAIFETMQPSDLKLTLEGKTIVFDEESIIHIVSRHYGPLMGSYVTTKSFHSQNFMPEDLVYGFNDIFSKISTSGGLKQSNLGSINFSYNGVPYRIYTTDRATNANPIRISTFFPIGDPQILQELQSSHNIVVVDNELSFYQKK